MTPDLSVELWPGESAYVRLVATSYPVKAGLADLGALVEADAMGELARAADGELDGVGPVIEGEQ